MTTTSTNKNHHQKIESLIDQRNDISTQIDELQFKLDKLSTERFTIDKEIQRLQFVVGSSSGNSSGGSDDCSANTIITIMKEVDPECSQLIASFEKIKKQFEDSCKTPREYDSEVPYRLSDDYADTHPFDDWTDQQLELFAQRREEIMDVADLVARCSAKPEDEDELVEEFSSSVERCLRPLFKATELINDMVETVGKLENAESGILLECRDNLMEHWHLVFGDETLAMKSDARQEEIDRRFTKFFQMNPDFYGMLVDELQRIGKPFSSLVTSASN